MALTLGVLVTACGPDEGNQSTGGGLSPATLGSATMSATTTGTTASVVTSSTALTATGPSSTSWSASSVASTGTAATTTGSGTGFTATSSGTASTSSLTSSGTGGGTTASATTDTDSSGSSTTGNNEDCTDTGAHESFSFFVTSYQHILELSGSENGFGGDLRYKGAATGLEGADAICQEIARRVCFGHRTWRAYLSTSSVNAKDRIGTGPWYDYSGALIANDVAGLLSGDRPAGGSMDTGTYDELGIFHDGNTDVNNDGLADDDHDTMTATLADGTYAGFSCDDWTSVTATDELTIGPMFSGGVVMGHSWPALSGRGWAHAHGGHQCAAGVNLIQDGPGDSKTVGGGGGYGGIYCFALSQ